MEQREIAERIEKAQKVAQEMFYSGFATDAYMTLQSELDGIRLDLLTNNPTE